MRFHRSVRAAPICALLVLGCAPGYIEARDLESNNQGPSACASACSDIGMRMGALVLVSDSVPACVCEPVPTAGDQVLAAGAGASAGHVVIAAAAAQAQAQAQAQQRRRQQQSAGSGSRR